MLRAKAVEQEERHASLLREQGALAEKHGGAKCKGTDKLKINVGGS